MLQELSPENTCVKIYLLTGYVVRIIYWQNMWQELSTNKKIYFLTRYADKSCHNNCLLTRHVGRIIC